MVLLFCGRRFAFLTAFTSVASLFWALCFFPALLLVFGPEGETGSWATIGVRIRTSRFGVWFSGHPVVICASSIIYSIRTGAAALCKRILCCPCGSRAWGPGLPDHDVEELPDQEIGMPSIARKAQKAAGSADTAHKAGNAGGMIKAGGGKANAAPSMFDDSL
jgi:hypothetical protein